MFAWARNRPRLAAAVAATAVLLGIGVWARSRTRAKDDSAAPNTATRRFLAGLSPARYTERGTDYSDPAFSPHRLGKPLSELRIGRDYDFARLKRVKQSLAGVDRRVALQALFDQICEGATTHRERFDRVLNFAQRASLHNQYLQPTWPDGGDVLDPLIVLELGEQCCGHVARLVVDLFQARGYRARLVQLGGHVIAEVHYDGGWHYCDADLFGNGEVVTDESGRVPSIAELSRRPFRIDALACNFEPGIGNYLPGSSAYPSYCYFSRRAYGDARPGFIRKTASLKQQKTWRDYGWNYFEIVPDERRRLSDFAPYYAPGAPRIVAVARRRQGSSVVWRVEWDPAQDCDGDLLGYRVFVGSRTRGWNYDTTELPEDCRDYKSSTRGWDPSMYAARFRPPPADVRLVETQSNTVELALPAGGEYFVSVMPFDRHGEQAGRTLYPLSEELRLPRPPAFAARPGSATRR